MAFPTPQLVDGRVSSADIVRCAYDLTPQEIRVWEVLNEQGPSRNDEVAESVGRDPSVVYRNLQKLLECGVVLKDKQTIEGGGYFYVYEALPKATVKAHLLECVDDWHAQMRSAIERL